ncbi:hypothetical protein KB20921_16970 [Edwardsiella ictaluri]|nr:hypothetical protein KH20906_16690 [Edwardsiella ictaluri]BEI02436.1 hypothetical protein KB20921_16970 [Edwardsiella ictaluri]BEI05902.1 hypothetical protein KH201010_16880 [Edwardsiella ictaluri]BEI09358.1 hypothetical protein STU22726_16890 [Edwardsiella ictaluri]BEI12838.1 hypothetical protein STU22816_16910 [Edwardsiella ictaluri]
MVALYYILCHSGTINPHYLSGAAIMNVKTIGILRAAGGRGCVNPYLHPIASGLSAAAAAKAGDLPPY